MHETGKRSAKGLLIRNLGETLRVSEHCFGRIAHPNQIRAGTKLPARKPGEKALYRGETADVINVLKRSANETPKNQVGGGDGV
jgi:hypothetical protein